MHPALVSDISLSLQETAVAPSAMELASIVSSSPEPRSESSSACHCRSTNRPCPAPLLLSFVSLAAPSVSPVSLPLSVLCNSAIAGGAPLLRRLHPRRASPWMLPPWPRTCRVPHPQLRADHRPAPRPPRRVPRQVTCRPLLCPAAAPSFCLLVKETTSSQAASSDDRLAALTASRSSAWASPATAPQGPSRSPRPAFRPDVSSSPLLSQISVSARFVFFSHRTFFLIIQGIAVLQKSPCSSCI